MKVSSQTVNTPITGVWQALLPPFPPTTAGDKGRLVLGPAAHQLEQKSRPLLAAMPTWTHLTVTVAANRRANPSAYAINTDNAAPWAVPAGLGQSTTASGASRTNSSVNQSLINAAESRNARNQPRTVETGRPQPAAILRCPHPNAVFASIAAAITSAVSARRGNVKWWMQREGFSCCGE